MFLCVGYIIFHVFLCDTFTRILQGCFINNGAILWLLLCQWKNLENMDKSDTTILHQEKTKCELYAYFLGCILQCDDDVIHIWKTAYIVALIWNLQFSDLIFFRNMSLNTHVVCNSSLAKTKMVATLQLRTLIHWGWMMHICVSKTHHHCFR